MHLRPIDTILKKWGCNPVFFLTLLPLPNSLASSFIHSIQSCLSPPSLPVLLDVLKLGALLPISSSWTLYCTTFYNPVGWAILPEHCDKLQVPQPVLALAGTGKVTSVRTSAGRGWQEGKLEVKGVLFGGVRKAGLMGCTPLSIGFQSLSNSLPRLVLVYKNS